MITQQDLPEMVEGQKYRIVTKTPRQIRGRLFVLEYLGERYDGSLLFDGRPFAGTQSFPLVIIDSIEPVADDTQTVLNRRL